MAEEKLKTLDGLRPGEKRTVMDGRIIIFSFTRTGTELNRKLCRIMGGTGRVCRGYTVEKYAGNEIFAFPGDRQKLIADNWGRAAFIFIGAAGIAVRYIAPSVKDKFTDSPVLVMDEKGRYVIPLLSGHIGGAVSLADEIGHRTGAVPVHTTATDVQRKFAADVFAKKNSLLITDRQKAKEISSAVLDGEKIACYIKYPEYSLHGTIPENISICRSISEAEAYRYRIIISDGPEKEEIDPSVPGKNDRMKGGTLLLKPKNITAGIGCRKGISPALLEEGLERILKENGLEPGQVERIASISLKKDERALTEYSGKYRIPFLTYTAEELAGVRRVTSTSEFVKSITGVDNVCERAALLGCKNGILIQGKCIENGMTAALARRPLEIHF